MVISGVSGRLDDVLGRISAGVPAVPVPVVVALQHDLVGVEKG